MGKGYKQAVYRKGNPQSSKHMKSCSNVLAVREIQIKTVR